MLGQLQLLLHLAIWPARQQAICSMVSGVIACFREASAAGLIDWPGEIE